MQRRSFVGGVGAAALVASLAAGRSRAADRPYTVALVPGLTTDAFYITMHRGAAAAARALGVKLVFQGAPAFNPVQQVPVLDAVLARRPDVLLIAPTDKTQLIVPLRNAFSSGVPVITVDTYIGTGVYQTGSGNADFPLAYIASNNTLGGAIAARALAKAIGDRGRVYVSNIEAGVSTTDQREAGFKQEMAKHPNITVLSTQFNDDDANKAASQAQSVLARHSDLVGVFGTNLFSAMGAGNGIQQGGSAGRVKVVAFDAPQSIVGNLKSGLVDIAIAQHPAEIGWFGVAAAYAHLTGQSIPPAIATGFTIIDKANVDDPATKQYLYSE
ncbi:ABC transporter substrate-binding protein [Lichenicoccus sp.]|uniref:ABC transporter substrate-binding protein n=1 Tax=Lichenicoccus sp. TaxID=2781899 RepID=UPI003D0F38A3